MKKKKKGQKNATLSRRCLALTSHSFGSHPDSAQCRILQQSHLPPLLSEAQILGSSELRHLSESKALPCIKGSHSLPPSPTRALPVPAAHPRASMLPGASCWQSNLPSAFLSQVLG